VFIVNEHFTHEDNRQNRQPHANYTQLTLLVPSLATNIILMKNV